MLARFGKCLVIVALVLTTGAHWAALQTVAWTTMLANNVCHKSFAQAVESTFDGKHPCCLCRAIAAAKKSGKKSEAVSPVLKMEFPPAEKAVVFVPPAPFELLPPLAAFADSLSSPPPVPPPRACLA